MRVHAIQTHTIEPGTELAEGLSKIIDKTIKDGVGLSCDLSIIVKGILLGAFQRKVPSCGRKPTRQSGY